jgi:hypothetical protein
MQPTLDLVWKVVSVLGGTSLIVFGMAAWLGKIWATRILEKDRQKYREELQRLTSTYEAANKSVQAELDKRSHVYRVQFETEFKALSEIWGKITDLRSDMAGIRPAIDSPLADGEDAIGRYRRRLERFGQTLAEFKVLVFKYAPFYPEEIYDRMYLMINLAGAEHVKVSMACRSGTTPATWFDDGEQQLNQMVTQANGISNAIRQRVQKLSFND